MQHHDAIETLIRQVKTRLKSLEMGAGLAWLLIFVVCFFFVEVVLDHLFALQRGTRLALLAVFKISSLGILALFVIVPLFRRINTFYVAKLIEDSYGAFKSSLISYLELRRSGDAPKEIVELVSRRASECAVETAPETVVNPTRFIQAGYVLLGAMVVFLVYVIVSPKSVGTSLMRAVFPERAILPPTRTSIVEVLPGDKAALEGSDVAVSVKIEGTIPDRADIHWTDDFKKWAIKPLTRGQNERWEGALTASAKRIGYFIAAGDSKSDVFEIRAVSAPIAQVVQVELKYPDYASLPPKVQDDGNIEALAGTEARVSAVTNNPVRQAFLVFDSGARQWMKRSDEGRIAGAFVVSQSGAYRVEFEDENGFRNSHPISYTIVCKDDQGPEIELLAPESDLTLAKEDALKLRIRAADDYGLSKAVLKFRREVGAERERELSIPTPTKSVTAERQFALSDLDMLEGDVLTYYVQVWDSRSPLPNMARTVERKVEITKRVTLAAKPEPSQPSVQPKPDAPVGPGEKATDAPENAAETGKSDDAKSGERPDEQRTAGLEQEVGKDKEVLEKIAQAVGTTQKADAGQQQSQDGTKGDAQPANQGAQQPAQQPQAQNQAQQQSQAAQPPQQGQDGQSAAGGQPQAGNQAAQPAAPGAQPQPPPAAQGQAQQQNQPGQPQQGQNAQSQPQAQQQDAQGQQPQQQGQQAAQTQQQGQSAQGQAAEPAPGQQGPAQGQPSQGQPPGQPQAGGQCQNCGAKLSSGGQCQNCGGQSPGVTQRPQTQPAQPATGLLTQQGQSSGRGQAQQGQAGSQTGTQPGPAQGAGQQASGQGSQGAGGTGQSSAGPPGQSPADAQGQGQGAGQGQSASSSSSSGSAQAGGGAMQQASGGGATPATGSAPGSGSSSGGGATPAPGTAPPTAEAAPTPRGEPQALDVRGQEVKPGTIAPAEDRVDVKGLIDKLSSQIEKGEVDKRLLDQLGWSEQELRNFVEKYRKLLTEPKGPPKVVDMGKGDSQPLDVPTSKVTVKRGTGAAAGVEDADATKRAKAEKDKLRAIEAAKENIAPEYRDLVEEYYKALGRTK